MHADGATSLEQFVNELHKAWKRLALYPKDHPARRGAMSGPFALLRGLLAPTGSLSFGITEHGLVVGEYELDSPGSTELARELYLRNVAVLRFDANPTRRELATFVLLLGSPSGSHGSRPPLDRELADAGVEKISVEAVDYSTMVAADASEEAFVAEADEGSLWDRILRARLGGAELLAAGERGSLLRVLDLVNRFLPRDAIGPDGEVAPEVAELLAMLVEAVDGHLEETGGVYGSAHSVQQVAELVGALPDGLRERFLTAALARMSAAGTEANAGDKLEALVTSAPAADMLACLRRLRDAGHTFSRHSLRIVQTLAIDTATDAGVKRILSADQLEEVMETILVDDTGRLRTGVDEFVLELPDIPDTPIPWTEELEDQRRTLTTAAVTQSLLRTLISLLDTVELDAVGAVSITKRLEELFSELVLAGRPFVAGALIQHLRGLAHDRDDMTGTGVRSLLHRLEAGASIEIISRVVRSGEVENVANLEPLVETLGRPTVRGLLMTLAEVEDRRERRRLYDFLKTQGAAAAREAQELLADERWYVVRNMISLLREIPGTGSIPEITACLGHEDARVRMEAARFLIARGAALDPAVVTRLLADPDPKVVAELVALLGHARARAAVAPLLEIVGQRHPLGKDRELRIAAIKSLGQIGDPSALAGLESFFRFSLLGPSAEERLAAYTSLAGYPRDARGGHLEKGLKARDARIQTVCRQLVTEDATRA